VNFHRRNGECILFESLSGAGEFHADIDFYENVCNGEDPIVVSKKIEKPTSGPALHGVGSVTENPFSVGAGVPVPGGVGVFTVCGLEGMQLQVRRTFDIHLLQSNSDKCTKCVSIVRAHATTQRGYAVLRSQLSCWRLL
jgi:hypothetical protein